MPLIGVKLSSPLPLSDDGLLSGDKQQESMSRRVVSRRRVDIWACVGQPRPSINIDIDCVAGVLKFNDRQLLNPKGAH